jgi:multidrug efflux pump subunit AcrA (membrane-fusion protein)
MNPEHPNVVILERIGWTVVKVAFVALVLMLVLNPATKGRAGFASTGLETVLPAQIKAAGLFKINAELSGTVTELAVKPGDTVEPGQLLAVIENPEIEGLVERARRRMELAGERLSQPAATAQPQRRWLDEQYAAAVRNLRAAEQREREFSAADSEQSYARARANAERVKALLDQRLATAREAEDAQREAAGELRNLKARREAGVRLQQELEAAQSQVKMAKFQLDSASPVVADTAYTKLEFEEAKAAYETLAGRRSGLRVVAERGGTVIQVNATQGGPVQEGAVLVQIASSSNLHFDVSAPASVAKGVHPGDQVLVRVPTDPPAEVPARVSQVLLEPDPQQLSYLIRVTIPNPAPDHLLVGLEGAVSFNH